MDELTHNAGEGVAGNVPVRADGESSTPRPTEPVAVPQEPTANSIASGRNLTRVMVLVGILVAIVLGPYVVGQYVYQTRYNALQAGVDVASGTLGELRVRLNDLEMASRLIAKRVEPSVVSIFRPTRLGREGQGSGVIVDPQGYIVTNYHVVAGDQDIFVELTDRRRTRGRVIGADPMTDLAVLKIDEPNLIAADWGDSDELQVGDLVWALGSPYGLDRSLTFGIVSAKARRSGTQITRSAYQEYLQTDAAVNPGNSGGPLVNIEGQIVGINAAIFGESYRGISFAIPSSMAREKYEELRSRGWIDRAWLGIAPLEVPDEVRQRLGLDIGEGVYVGRVEDNAPASRAGIRPGDVILRWNEHAATDPTLLSREIAATEIGSTAKVVLARRERDSSDIYELDVEVDRHPWAVQVGSGQ